MYWITQRKKDETSTPRESPTGDTKKGTRVRPQKTHVEMKDHEVSRSTSRIQKGKDSYFSH